jgi:hypothetical protein
LLTGLAALQILAEQQLGRRRVEEDLVTVDYADRLDQLAVRARLEHVARAARLDHRQQVLLLGVHGQDEHFAGQPERADAARRLQSPAARHGDVHHDHVWAQRLGLAHRLLAVAGLADDFHVRLGAEQRAQTRPQHGVVVG